MEVKSEARNRILLLCIYADKNWDKCMEIKNRVYEKHIKLAFMIMRCDLVKSLLRFLSEKNYTRKIFCSI